MRKNEIPTFLFIHIREECVPSPGVVGVLYRQRRVEPVAAVACVVYDDAALQMLGVVFLVLHIFEQGIVFQRSFRVAVLCFRVEEEYLAVVHPYHKIDIEERLVALAVGVCYGVVLTSLVSVLVPLVYAFAV